jgi:hypothetical protein
MLMCAKPSVFFTADATEGVMPDRENEKPKGEPSLYESADKFMTEFVWRFLEQQHQAEHFRRQIAGDQSCDDKANSMQVSIVHPSPYEAGADKTEGKDENVELPTCKECPWWASLLDSTVDGFHAECSAAQFEADAEAIRAVHAPAVVDVPAALFGGGYRSNAPEDSQCFEEDMYTKSDELCEEGRTCGGLLMWYDFLNQLEEEEQNEEEENELSEVLEWDDVLAWEKTVSEIGKCDDVDQVTTPEAASSVDDAPEFDDVDYFTFEEVAPEDPALQAGKKKRELEHAEAMLKAEEDWLLQHQRRLWMQFAKAEAAHQELQLRRQLIQLAKYAAVQEEQELKQRPKRRSKYLYEEEEPQRDGDGFDDFVPHFENF